MQVIAELLQIFPQAVKPTHRLVSVRGSVAYPIPNGQRGFRLRGRRVRREVQAGDCFSPLFQPARPLGSRASHIFLQAGNAVLRIL